uniref:Uncharacterized protein n=1 Tax=Oryzias melastigma TaxID=30732 RepID=A0A3B3BPW3_ORYME
MPECMSVSEFVEEVQEDWSSPTTSSFTSKMTSCRNTVYLLEEVSPGGGGGGYLRDIKGVRNRSLKKKILHAEVWILTAALLSLQDLKKPFERAWRDYESRL